MVIFPLMLPADRICPFESGPPITRAPLIEPFAAITPFCTGPLIVTLPFILPMVTIRPLIGPLMVTWLIRLPPQMIWPARPEPLASMRVVVSMGTRDDGDVVT